MLTLSRIREEKEALEQAYKKRNLDLGEELDALVELDEKRRQTQHSMDEAQSQVNNLSKEIGELFKSGKAEEANAKKAEVETSKTKVAALKTTFSDLSEQIEEQLFKIPNAPQDEVPAGKGEDENEEVYSSVKETPSPKARPHWELGTDYNLFSMDLGTKITGAGFPVYIGKGAKLQRALISFFLDKASEAGYLEYLPPLMVNAASAFGTGQLPDKEGQMYHVTEDELFLIPTAEVPITNVYRDALLNESDLPIKMTGFSSCFRREAGSYGAEVRGLNRVHQFEKVEIVQIVKPEDSNKVLDEMVAHVQSLLEALELPFRILRLCGGDLGFAAAITYDFEVYAQGQGRWLEVSSVSNFETFQSNRLKLRYKDADNNKHLLHTLNGSALALARIVACILENYQDEGGIKVPEVLRKYIGFDTIS